MEKQEKRDEDLRGFAMPRFDDFPGIDLYMDQLITYTEKYVTMTAQDDKDKPITPAMINNYVKAGVLPRPENKKYSGEHIALLLQICMLKPVLSIARISRLINMDKDIAGGYDRFCSLQEEALRQVWAQAEEAVQTADSDPQALAALAYHYALLSGAYKTAAERVISMLGAEENGKPVK